MGEHHGSSSNREVIKCVVVGDSGVGKSCLICSYACGTRYDLHRLVETHQSTVFAIDTYQRDQQILERSWTDVDGFQVSLRLWDTFGHHGTDRSFAYQGSDVIILCFSVMQPNTLRNVLRIWLEEIQRCVPNVPVILCGTQADLRYLCFDCQYLKMQKGLLYRAISPKDMIMPNVGREVAKDIGAPYYETSVLTRYGIMDVFVNAARAALIGRHRIKFLNSNVRRIQKPLVQPPMKIPMPLFKDDSFAQPNTKAQTNSDNIGTLINYRSECDVTFLIQNQSIDAHRVCLAVASKFFKDLFSLESLAKFQTRRKINAQLRKRFPNRFSHTDMEHLLDSDSESLGTDTDTGSSFQDSSIGDNYLNVVGGGNTNRSSIYNFPLLIAYDHEAVESIEIRYEGDGADTLVTLITLCPDISAKTFRVILDYLYQGKLQSCDVDLKDLLLAAELLQLSDLVLVINNKVKGHTFLNTELETKFEDCRVEQLRELIQGPEFLTDITFQVDNGLVCAHKVLLMTRCEVMYAMFSGDFIESASDIIPFPGLSCETFKALQYYLYTGLSPSLDEVDCLGLLEVANRLCLSRLVEMVQDEVIVELGCYDNKDQLIKDALILLEPAEQYNAHKLSRYCKHTLSVNFKDVFQRHTKLFKGLSPDKQEEIEKQRWPPVWYLKEAALYERQVQSFPHSTSQTASQEYSFKRSCLCFCSRRGKHVLSDPVQLPS